MFSAEEIYFPEQLVYAYFRVLAGSVNRERNLRADSYSGSGAYSGFWIENGRCIGRKMASKRMAVCRYMPFSRGMVFSGRDIPYFRPQVSLRCMGMRCWSQAVFFVRFWRLRMVFGRSILLLASLPRAVSSCLYCWALCVHRDSSRIFRAILAGCRQRQPLPC